MKMKLQALYPISQSRQWLLLLSFCTLMTLFFASPAYATVLDTLPPRDVFSYHNDVGYIDPSIDQFESAAIELSNNISAIFGVPGLKVYAYAMYPKSHPAGKSLSFSTLWQKGLSRIEEEVIALKKPALRSTDSENYYLYIAWQLDASGKVAEARVRCKLPAAPESECGASESLLELEENISQTFHSVFVSTYNRTLTPGRAGFAAIEAIKDMLKGMDESSFEVFEGPPLPDSCERVCYPAGSVFVTPSRQLIRIEEEICPRFNFGEIPSFPIGCLVGFTTYPGNVRYSTITVHYTPAEIKSRGTLARGCNDNFWAYVKTDKINQYRDSDGKLTKWGNTKTVANKKDTLESSRFKNYSTTGGGAIKIQGVENGVFVTYTFNINLPSSLDLEGPYSGGSLIIPPGTSPLCTFCDKSSPGAHYYDKAKRAGMSPEQFLLLCKNARALNELSKKWNINLDKKVDIDRWYDIMQTFYSIPRGVFDDVTEEERLNKLYQFIIYYRENVEYLKNIVKEDIGNLSRIYIKPELIGVLSCADRIKFLRILCSEGPRKLKGSHTIAYDKAEDTILKLLRNIGVDKKCFLDSLIADKNTFCTLMEGFIDNGVKGYLIGDGNNKKFIELLLNLYFEVLNSYSQSALRALVRTDRVIQVGFSPYVAKASSCAPIHLKADFDCNGNIVSGLNSISLADSLLTSATSEAVVTSCTRETSPFTFGAFDLVMVYNYGGDYPVLNSLPKNIPVPAFILPYLAQVNQNENAGEAIQWVLAAIGAYFTAGTVVAAIEVATAEAYAIAALEAVATLGDFVRLNRRAIIGLFPTSNQGTAFLNKLDNVFIAISVASMKGFNVAEARKAVDELEEGLSQANRLSPMYNNLRTAVNSLRTALRLVGISIESEFLIRVKAAFVAVGKKADDVTANNYLEKFKGLIGKNNVLSLPHLSDDFLRIYEAGSLKVKKFLEDAVSDWDDPVSFAKFVEDIKARPSLLDDMAGNGGMLNAWKALSDRPDWVRLNSNLLSRLADKDAAYLTQVNEFYTSANFSAPSGFNGPGRYGSVDYDEFGFPLFENGNFTPGREYNARITMNGNDSDYNLANTILESQGVEIFRIPLPGGGTSNGSPIRIKINGRWEGPFTWHHHQDGQTMIPVLQSVHNSHKHTGGRTTVRRRISDIFR